MTCVPLTDWHPPGSVPGAPIIKSITTGDCTLSVDFEPASNDGGRPVLSYVVRVEPGAREEVVTSSPVVLSGLENGTAYTVSVAQTNELGQGPFSRGSAPSIPGKWVK